MILEEGREVKLQLACKREYKPLKMKKKAKLK